MLFFSYNLNFKILIIFCDYLWIQYINLLEQRIFCNISINNICIYIYIYSIYLEKLTILNFCRFFLKNELFTLISLHLSGMYLFLNSFSGLILPTFAKYIMCRRLRGTLSITVTITTRWASGCDVTWESTELLDSGT